MTKFNYFTFILICLLLSLGQLQRFEVANGISFYAHDLVISAWVIINAITYKNFLITQLLSLFKKQRSLIIVLLIILLGWLAAWWRSAEILTAGLYTVRLVLYLTFGLLLKIVSEFKPIDHYHLSKKTIRLTLILSGVLTLIFGLWQYLFFPDTRFLALFGWDDHYFRLISTLFDPAFTGLVLVMTWALLITSRLPVRILKIKTDFWIFLILSLLITGLLLTYSRSSYLAFLASWCYLWLFKSKLRQTLFLLALITLIGLLFLPKPTGEGGIITRTSTVRARQGSLTTDIKSFQPQDLIVGQGLFVSDLPTKNEVPFVITNHARIPDNSMVFLVQSFGLIGATLVGLQLFKLFIWSHQQDRGLAAVFVALAIHSQFNASLVQPFILLWLLISLASVAKSRT
jgi:hypothetical protein